MILDDLKSKCLEIEKSILSIKTNNPDIKPISDGIVNIEEYLQSKYRILWILKESNDVRNGKGGGWKLNVSMNEDMKDWKEKSRTGKTTFKRIILTTYGIENNFMQMEDIPNINTLDVFTSIKQIALINVKKIPGGSSSFGKQIALAYKENRHILLKQIELYNPNIIIGGNTLQYFIKDLAVQNELKKKIGNRYYYPEEKKLFIAAYHPNVRPKTISEKDYCNQIINAVKDWEENYRSKSKE